MRRVILFIALFVCLASFALPSDAAPSNLHVIATFVQLSQGASPMAGLIESNGVLFGTASIGGTNACRCGTVFSVVRHNATWTLKTLYSFRGGSDGHTPTSSLMIDKTGALYGTTVGGGNGCSGGCGIVFKLTPSGSTYVEHVLYRFKGGSDGAGPSGSLIADEDGALYGLTGAGGSGTACQSGCGVVYRLKPSPSGYTESVLYRFLGGANDGASPAFTALVGDRRGDLFGTTIEGGNQVCQSGCGTAFELTPAGNGYAEHILHLFAGPPDGARPYGGLIVGADGVLYGTTEIGGDLSACPSFGGCGTVFRLSESRFKETVVYAFLGGKDAYAPLQALVADAAGALYGASPGGGYQQVGVLFKLTPSNGGFVESVLHEFRIGADGYGPYGSLIIDNAGTLFGTAIGGPYGGGEVFEYKQ